MRRSMALRALGVLLVGLMIGLFLACDSNGGGDSISKGTGEGELTVGGQTYSLTKLYFLDWGQSEGVYNIDVYIMSEGLDVLPDRGTGEIVYLEMFFNTAAVTAGTYSFATTEAAGTFSDASDILIGYRPATDTEDAWYWMDGGTVTISISGSDYTINGNVDLDGGGNATFWFSGRLTGSFSILSEISGFSAK